jgi:hypothetical protein
VHQFWGSDLDPKNKVELLALLRSEYGNFAEATAGLSEAQMTAPGAEVKWSVKDIAAHLLFWQGRAVFLLECASTIYQPDKDRWRGADVDTHNEQNFQAQRARPTADVLRDLAVSQKSVVDLLEALPEDAIFTPGRFDWLKGISLAEGVGNETYGHYEEHMGSLRAWRAKQA